MIEQFRSPSIFVPKFEEPKTEFDIREHTLPTVDYESVDDVLRTYISETISSKEKSVISPVKLPNNIRFLFVSVDKAKNYLNIKSYDEEDGSEKYILRSLYEPFVDTYSSSSVNSHELINGAYAGIGFVYNVFDVQSGGELKKELKKLVCNPEKHNLIMDAIAHSMTDHERSYSISERSNINDRTNPVLKIPDYQSNLQSGVDYIRTLLPLMDFMIEDGAISTYRTLEKLWPHMDLNTNFAA